MKFLNYCKLIIEYSFYSLFFLVPLIFWGSTSELFELNKIWLTYAITLIIAAAWITEMIIEKQIKIRKTPLDIFLILFLISQTLSTIFSFDTHVSFFGYYSRFNGGLLSTIAYVFLYFAFATHFTKKQVYNLIKITLISGLVVILWGLPSHFGKDPTCYIFRGTLDVSCWTEAFKPTIRMFSTLGQPAWLAAFLAFLTPISIAFVLINTKYEIRNTKQIQNSNDQNHKSSKKSNFEHSNLFRASIFDIRILSYLILSTLFYISLLFTNTRAGFIAFWVANAFFWFIIYIKKILTKKIFLTAFLILNFAFLISNFFIGTPVAFLNKFTLNELIVKTRTQPQTAQTQKAQQQTAAQPEYYTGITDSGTIRLYVWKGAVDAWKAYPIIGSGVETFAFAYYRYRPIEHNMTSEWDYLYNRAHNEFLNYLTTSGILGLGTYLLIIATFLLVSLKYLILNIEYRNPKQIQNLNDQNHKNLKILNFEHSDLFRASSFEFRILIIALLSSYISILITNFFGFSIVIMNLLFFLTPAMVFILGNILKEHAWYLIPQKANGGDHISINQWVGIAVTVITIFVSLVLLFNDWQADKNYSMGYNLNRSGYPQEAYTYLTNTVNGRPSEPVYQDELSLAAMQYALGEYELKNATKAAELAQQSLEINNKVLTEHPNYLPFWKTKIRLLYTLGQIYDPYLKQAVTAAEHTASLAPTDAKSLYNLGVLYGQAGDLQKSITTLEKTIKMKPDYQDVYVALALMYHESALDNNGTIIKPELQDKAIQTLKFVLEKLNPKNDQALKTLQEWGE